MNIEFVDVSILREVYFEKEYGSPSWRSQKTSHWSIFHPNQKGDLTVDPDRRVFVVSPCLP